ncbi:hypothetical protein [Actinoplanes siamensis]|uniref:Uncharacterized protein n=1 Tax=Actinoplanes siamensis TaxID=1223317 RepID=A0A919TJX7_9ACTN|nr:hypothetical protein [Actinoplanes siamensis]GIF04720.1 hypothetical protein Asi03nite_22580 [Actinoplanes siamensis]
MEKILCFRCGGDVPADQPWCGYCAAPVVAVPPPAPPASAPPATGPSLSLGPPAPVVPRRGLVLIALMVIGVLLMSGGIVTAVLRVSADSPRAAAERYFGALAAGDATRALGQVASAGQFDRANYPLLSKTALGERRYRPRDVRLGDDTAAGSQFGTEARRVRISYRAGDRTVDQDVVAVKEGSAWRLRLPFVLLGVVGQRGRQVTVNGVALGAAARATAAFPGMYEAVAAGNTLLAESRATAVAQAGGVVGLVAPLQFGVPELAAGAEQDIQRQVRTALDKCATSRQAEPAGCPFGLNVPGTKVTVWWSITTYPQVSVRTDSVMWFSGAAVQVVDDGAGRVHWNATYTDQAGTAKSQSGDSAFRINGNAQATPTGIQVSLI